MGTTKYQFGLVVLTLFFVSTTSIDPNASGQCNKEVPEEIDIYQLKAGLAEGSIFLVDVRRCSELQRSGFIPGAFHSPLPFDSETFANRILPFEDQIEENGANIVFYCRSGKRASSAYPLVKDKYCNAKVYKGSFGDWIGHGELAYRTAPINGYTQENGCVAEL